MNIIQQIDKWSEIIPGATVYDYLGDRRTYSELRKMSDSLAQKLIDLELPKKAPILVFGGQTFEMLVSFLAIVKAGHSYVPLDCESPNERIIQIAKIAKPAACIAVEKLPVKIDGLTILDSEKLEEVFAGEGREFDATEYQVSGDDIFYTIFTSGTTGLPKGVQISANNLQSFLNWMKSDFGITAGKTFLAQPAYSFDLSVMSIYPALTQGGKLTVLPKKVTDNFKNLFELLPKLKLNIWVSTPSFMDICLLDKHFNEDNYPTITHFLFCGEELTHEAAKKLNERFPRASIYNTYGPTEATVAVSQVLIDENILANYPRLPIGVAKDDTELLIVDEDLHEVPNGTLGELLIVGPSVSKGYLNNPEKTGQAFIDYKGRHAYRTGDLAEVDDQGQLLYHGRIDFQVKLHGFRIELEEVDQHLNQVSLVKQATCATKYDANHKATQIVAYVVPEPNNYKSEFALTKVIKKELTTLMMPYMIPQKYVYVESLPLTNNGKVDRKKILNEVNS
ncbi:D-alanine--poly(phosphoribitol) ligase subunit DltA [Liquorilactobacillus mali]|uniref:D-alanine--poly(phosphoribitol) ligase subunit DltA n=1 Tax=Liquorilactobacillus mali TaxID=1618 RepID=UPI002954FDF0|nr:D-alanine--poly(phosphoribitol) ligase subunit DltA [Liquorilactobacillus mali]MDV7756845.1 D-alanine--poly(phosphoribitol) ligase subunit DltA [Liquorilactobacillus mali]